MQNNILNTKKTIVSIISREKKREEESFVSFEIKVIRHSMFFFFLTLIFLWI